MINTVCGITSTGKICTDIADMLTSKGHECKIAYGRGIVPEKYQKYAVRIGSDRDVNIHAALTRITDRTGFYSTSATRKFINWIKEYNPDIIHLHNIHGYYINIKLLFQYLKEAKCKVVWTLHDCWSFTGHCAHFDYIGCRKWETRCEQCPQYRDVYPYALFKDNTKNNHARKQQAFTGVPCLTVVTPSRWLAGFVRESYLGEYPVRVIPNGIDLDRFRPVEKGLRKRLHMEDKYIILGVASMWEERKGYAYFEKLAELLEDSFRIILIGLSKEKLKKLHPKIYGVMRTDSIEELAEYYSMADVYVNTTLEDTFPTTNLEALACGTPVITFATGGSVESVDERTGKVVPKGDTEALLQAIEELRREPSKRADCLRKAAEYDKHDRFQEYLELYQELLEE